MVMYSVRYTEMRYSLRCPIARFANEPNQLQDRVLRKRKQERLETSACGVLVRACSSSKRQPAPAERDQDMGWCSLPKNLQSSPATEATRLDDDQSAKLFIVREGEVKIRLAKRLHEKVSISYYLHLRALDDQMLTLRHGAPAIFPPPRA
ncbi:uncharacterized protein PHACADRAFT_266154 [Phanerochaete carnosa HHB-10118-sp]|uniref:Uncharacterized protein n=1 Tax=Phanerochaete carnosa (strain HHB-10118-sp) TaxID=650164 RepID=K5VPW9_PHACS|nr:uncharacterized protein PHACADRAFT_265972 [Phanerochaete carnosa HHB-10118-sp]XP_007402681.1 uncharacterized protein PHACADRAFT_266154 [Phanerochaete carnosa HHB-10118-sp]EKM48765.1 hypothetical protein PHACADRAFT_266154 [Phanerochaete carnosa HHB-10118-sp]EKM48938.1 hypothetical protein PHACADRAFT_265972 [Phanerochaete carnosa HHB-10118-sp]